MKNGKSLRLVPSICLRVHIRDGLKKAIQADERTAISQLHRKGLSKKTITELTPKATTLCLREAEGPAEAPPRYVKRHSATCQPPTPQTTRPLPYFNVIECGQYLNSSLLPPVSVIPLNITNIFNYV